MKNFFRIKISDDRAITVRNEIAKGSVPEGRFYVMVAVSSMIASFGLTMDSTAVVIGAMLVAPLMTPIFGIALALVRGDASLLGKSIQAEIVGVFLAIVVGVGIGAATPELVATEEMLRRMQPNLLDLFVAVAAGFAGAYALVDEHISPALPGVAVATAIVPPLANTGLCLALGASYGALGSFLLFFANFLSILLVASAVFFAARMSRDLRSILKKELIRRFGLASIGFLIVALLLGKGLYDMVRDRQFKGAINEVLVEELSHLPASELGEVLYRKHKDKIYCLAHVHATSYLSPRRVKAMEQALESRLATGVELFVRSTLSEDVSSTGSINQIEVDSLTASLVKIKLDPKIELIKTAEQILREYTDQRPSMYVTNVNLLTLKNKKILLASIQGLKALTRTEIADLEEAIMQRSGVNELSLVIRPIDLRLKDRYGLFSYEWMSLEDVPPEKSDLLQRIISKLSAEVEKDNFKVIDSRFTVRSGQIHILLEVAGADLYPREAYDELLKYLPTVTRDPVHLYIRSRPEVVLTNDGVTSFKDLQNRLLRQAEDLYEEELRDLVEGAL